jgi:hypothetical protein
MFPLSYNGLWTLTGAARQRIVSVSADDFPIGAF